MCLETIYRFISRGWWHEKREEPDIIYLNRNFINYCHLLALECGPAYAGVYVFFKDENNENYKKVIG